MIIIYTKESIKYIIRLFLVLCKPENEILKAARKAQKGHSLVFKCDFLAFSACLKISFSSLHNPNYIVLTFSTE